MCEMNQYFNLYKDTPPLDDKEYRASVHYNDFRLKKAEEQSKLESVEIEKIIEYINQFLEFLEMDKVNFPKMNRRNIYYKKIQKDNNLRDVRDIVWLKFTKDGYLGVVATSNDINFDIPESKEAYNQNKKEYDQYSKTEKRVWVHNTAGIIVHHVNKSWDETFVLVFPLKNIKKNLTRSDIERGIGNYLIAKGVPILDFYSHNY